MASVLICDRCEARLHPMDSRPMSGVDDKLGPYQVYLTVIVGTEKTRNADLCWKCRGHYAKRELGDL